VGGEDRGDLRHRSFQVKHSRSCQPFVKMSHYQVTEAEMTLVETLDDLTCSIAEQRRFYVIPAPSEGVNLQVRPQLPEDPVIGREQGGMVHQDHHRTARNLPSADPDLKALLLYLLFQC